jgi:hypothetical protein
LEISREEVKAMTMVTMRKIMLLCALLALLTVVFVLGVGIDVADAARFKTH